MKSALVIIFFFFFFFLSAHQAQGASFSLPNLNHHEIPIHVPQPESIAFDCNGAPYVGVADGRIFKWLGHPFGWREFAVTSPNRPRGVCDLTTNKDNEPICGRPLGLKFDLTTCELYIADAYFGLLKAGPNGGVAQILATSAEGVPFRFLNGVDIDRQSGMVYFTDTSAIYQRRNWELSVSTGDKTGRLMRYDPWTKNVTVLRDDLSFANGVALSKDGDFVLVTQTTAKNILRYWLRGPRANTVDIFFQLQGAPDNIIRNINGEFWVAENSAGKGKAVKLDAQGNFLDVVDGLNPVSHVEQRYRNLWIGSVVNNFVGVILNFV
ncbi:protein STRICTOSIDINE SYNTHASE-LIKE 10-like [Rosa sericea]